MTVAELHNKAEQSYLMALASNDDAEAKRFYALGDRYYDMADGLTENEEQRELELA